ncbi:hypothetical protein GCM10023065_01610 [Microbacterium laevaniformans]|uniref:histidine phosphatase family protein n=2 Tax=Microbacterium laevaniformans TaxID=36807 RepID=UPI00195CEF0A|nr:histidine phosphatase family protein [Microbacterium laevaniformans]GLJ65824.1 hypothetical protein GCM10017578_27140 [Microbacterium laevaniformans]
MGSKTMELVLVRHGTSTRAQEGVWGRLYDAPLADGFESQLMRSRLELQDAASSTIVSSPLTRCMQTAAFIFPDSPVAPISAFRAFHSGIFEDATESYIRERHPEYLELTYRQRFLNPRYGEESIHAQVRRVAGGLFDVLDTDDEQLVIVSHYSSMNIIANIGVRNWRVDTHADGAYDIALGSYFRLLIDPGAVREDIARQLDYQPQWQD